MAQIKEGVKVNKHKYGGPIIKLHGRMVEMEARTWRPLRITKFCKRFGQQWRTASESDVRNNLQSKNFFLKFRKILITNTKLWFS